MYHRVENVMTSDNSDMPDLRKVVFTREVIYFGVGEKLPSPVTRVLAAAVILNPFVGAGYIEDLSILFDLGRRIGEKLMPEVVSLLPGTHPTSYGKAAIVGISGELEHGAALIHPLLGKPMRSAVGGGEAIICSNAKVAVAGATIDVPLANKDNIWAFDYLDTLTFGLADAPRPNEIIVILAVADAGRPNARVGKGKLG